MARSAPERRSLYEQPDFLHGECTNATELLEGDDRHRQWPLDLVVHAMLIYCGAAMMWQLTVAMLCAQTTLRF